MFTELERFHASKAHAERTRRTVNVAVRHFVRLGFAELNSDTLSMYRDARLKEGASASTVRGELNKLCSFARWLGHTIDITLPHEVQRVPVAWSREEMATLMREAGRTRRVVYAIPGHIFWPSLLNVCYDTGERISALMAVEWGSLDFKRQTLLCRAEIRKGQRADKLHHLSAETIGHLRQLGGIVGQQTHRPVFGHGSMSTLWEALDKLLRDAGLPCDRRRKFHCLRRTAASEVHLAGGDATEFLGHSSDAITRQSYLAPSAYRRKLPWRPARWLRWLGL